MATRAERAGRRGRPDATSRPGRWRGPVAGLVTILVVAVPTMVVAEDWHGHPMIDEAGAWWLIPATVAVGGFFMGGAVSARRPAGEKRLTVRARVLAAVVGALLGAAGAAVLVAADGMRRLLLNPTLPTGVVDYWLEAAAVAVVVAALGALVVVTAGGRSRS